MSNLDEILAAAERAKSERSRWLSFDVGDVFWLRDPVERLIETPNSQYQDERFIHEWTVIRAGGRTSGSLVWTPKVHVIPRLLADLPEERPPLWWRLEYLGRVKLGRKREPHDWDVDAYAEHTEGELTMCRWLRPEGDPEADFIYTIMPPEES